MIKSFGDIETERIWLGKRSKKLPNQIQNVARRKHRMINNAANLNDLRIPSLNRLDILKWDLKEYYSIRINNQWRIIFEWRSSNALNVKIINYHEQTKEHTPWRNSAGRIP